MVSIDVTKLASKIKDGAKTVFQTMKENPAEGSIFDAAQKLGINNKEDLKAGIELFKEDPTGTVNSALQTLQEKGFKFSGAEMQKNNTKEFSVDNIGKSKTAETTAKAAKTTTTQTPQIEQKTTTEETADKTGSENTEEQGKNLEFGGILGKLGIKNEADLKAAWQKIKENPQETTQSMAKTLGLSENVATKISDLISKFVKKA